MVATESCLLIVTWFSVRCWFLTFLASFDVHQKPSLAILITREPMNEQIRLRKQSMTGWLDSADGLCRSNQMPAIDWKHENRLAFCRVLRCERFFFPVRWLVTARRKQTERIHSIDQVMKKTIDLGNMIARNISMRCLFLSDAVERAVR